MGAAITVSRYHTGFSIGSATYSADVTELGLSLRQHFTNNFSMTMEGGYADMTQPTNPVAGALSPTGYFGNVSARYQVPFGAHLSMDLTAAGGYHRLDDSKGAASVVERWWSYSATVGPRFSWNRVGIEAGLVYRHASGKEESAGLTGSLPLGFEHTTNPYVDVTFELSRDGTVTLHAEGGARRGVSVIFGYLFSAP